LVELVKGFVKKGDLHDLKEELMNELTEELDKIDRRDSENTIFMESMEENMLRLIMLIQNVD
jgi:hypothetical protein